MNTHTQGSKALAEAGSIREVAKKLGVASRSVSAWRSGEKIPNDTSRQKIAAVLAISVRSWDERASAPTPKTPGAPMVPVVLPADAAGLDALIAQLEAARAAPNVSAAALSKLGAVECRAREARSRVAEWTKASLLASPVFRRVETAIAEAIGPCCAQAVQDALGQLDGVDGDAA